MANLDPIIRALVGVPQGLLPIVGDVVNRLGSKDGERWRTRFAQIIQEGLAEVKETLLALVSTVPIPARSTKFVVADEFSVGNHDGLKIAYWGDNFKGWFGKKVEEPTDTAELVVSKLTKYAYDTEIVQALGGDEKAETAMSELASLLKKQGNGQEGVLRTDGYANIAYVRDIKGILRAVHAHWCGDGWDLDARAVDNPYRWDAGLLVVSRK